MKKALTFFALLLSLYGNAQTVYSLDEAKLMAKATNKLILIDFTATWCGPCTKMEFEFWQNEQYKQTTHRFVIAKIDIDQQPPLATYYNVRSIPNIKIVDIEGTELYGFTGYQDADKIEKDLSGFPESVGDLYDAMEYEKKEKPTAEECLYVASSYQNMLQRTVGLPRQIFLKQSNGYFSKCKRSNPSDSIAQKADIGRAFNYVLDNNPQKAIKQLNIETVHEANKSFVLYILARAYADLKDSVNAEKYLAMLENLHEDQWKNPVALLRKQLQ